MNIEILEQIGLTKSEIKVYLALLELGSSSTGKIVDKSKVASSKIYEILDKLIQKGLVSFIIKSGVKYFESAPPERIMDYMEEREKRFNRQKQDLKKILPELELKQKIAKYKSEATIYKGVKGMETAFYDALNLLKPGDEHLVLGVPKRSEPVNRFFIRFNKERAGRKIKNRIIFNEETRTDPKTAHQTYTENNPLSKIKFTNEVIPAAINIFKDRVVIFPAEVEEPLIIVIDNKEIAESFRVQFEKWWDQKVQAFQGQEAVENAYASIKSIAKPEHDVVIFAAKPETQRGADYNVNWNKDIRKIVKNVRLLYYGANEKNKARAKELSDVGCETKILTTQEDLPISTIIIGDVILNTVWHKNPIAFKIKDKITANAFKNNFELLWNQKVKTYEGFDAVMNRFESMLDEMKKGEEYQVLGATYGLGGKKLIDWFMDYHRKRVKKGIKVKLLARSGEKEVIHKELTETGDIDMNLGEYKFTPPEFSSPMQINLYPNNKVLMFLFGKDITCFEIDSKILHDNFKNYFDMLWKKDKF